MNIIKDKLGNDLTVGDIVVDDYFRVGRIVSFTKGCHPFYWAFLEGMDVSAFTVNPDVPVFNLAKLSALNDWADKLK